MQFFRRHCLRNTVIFNMALLQIALCATLIAVAAAHATLNPRTFDPAGGYTRLHLRVPHGCKDPDQPDSPDRFPTTKVWIRIPSVVASESTARPEVIPGWSVKAVDEV